MPQSDIEKRIRVDGKIPTPVNKYYLRISKGYKRAGVILLAMLLLLIMLVIAFFGDSFTYENFRYLARDFGTMISLGNTDLPGASFAEIKYETSAGRSFEYFQNGMAIADTGRYSYFDSSGIQVISDVTSCFEPVMASSDKYMMVYDLGGNTYSIYNQLTRIVKRTADNSIVAGDISNSGSYVIVTRSRETKYVAEIYNHALNHSMSVYKENYVLGAAISRDGETVMIASAIPSDTSFSCEVMVYRDGSSENAAAHVYQHTTPLKAYSVDDGFVLLCDNALYFYDNDGNVRNTVGFSGTALRYADVCDGCIAAVCRAGGSGDENRILVLGNDGEIITDRVSDRRITGIAASRSLEDSIAYIETPEEVIKLNPDGSETVCTISEDAVDIVPLRYGIMVCTKNGAYMELNELLKQ